MIESPKRVSQALLAILCGRVADSIGINDFKGETTIVSGSGWGIAAASSVTSFATTADEA